MILFYIAIGFIAGYIVKDLLTKESEVIYHIKRLRAKRGGIIDVDADARIYKDNLDNEHIITSKPKTKQTKEKKQRRRLLRKNK